MDRAGGGAQAPAHRGHGSWHAVPELRPSLENGAAVPACAVGVRTVFDVLVCTVHAGGTLAACVHGQYGNFVQAKL